MNASGDHAAYLIRPDSVSSFATPGAVPGMGAEGADGRDKRGHDEVREKQHDRISDIAGAAGPGRDRGVGGIFVSGGGRIRHG